MAFISGLFGSGAADGAAGAAGADAGAGSAAAGADAGSAATIPAADAGSNTAIAGADAGTGSNSFGTMLSNYAQNRVNSDLTQAKTGMSGYAPPGGNKTSPLMALAPLQASQNIAALAQGPQSYGGGAQQNPVLNYMLQQQFTNPLFR